MYKRKISDGSKQQKVDFAFVPIIREKRAKKNWEWVFKFGPEVRGGVLKIRQEDFETTSEETKEDRDGVIEAKTWEDEAIMKC